MMKWLRAHSKQIMVVTVLLAMFSFVGGSALVQILSPNPDKEAVVRAFGREYQLGDVRAAYRDTEILKELGISWQYDRPTQRMSVEHWFVLTQEAARAGLAVSDTEVENQLQDVQRMIQMMTNNTVDVLEVMRRGQLRATPPEVRRAISNHILIMKHAEHLGQSAAPSESQLRHYVRDTQDKVKVQFVALDAEKFMDANLPLPADQVQAQFEKYKDVDRGHSDTGYGYKHPRRVKLQYAVANIKKIEPQLAVPFEEVKNYWKANKSKYKKIVYEDPPPTSQPATSQPTSQPKPTPIAKSVEKTLAEAKPDVERDLRKKNAQRLSEQAMAKLALTMQKPWLEERTDPETGYKSIPAAAKEPDALKNAAERMSKEFGVAIDYKETGLLSDEDIEAQADLRNATVAVSSGSGMKISEFAFRVPKFFKQDKENSNAELGMSLQLFQSPDLPLTASDINIVGGRFTLPKDRLILFRVIEADDAHAPASLEEVRAQVEKDLRIAAAMKSLEPTAQQVAAAAQHLGLKDAWAMFADLHEKTGVKEPTVPPPFARKARLEDAKRRDALVAGESSLAAPQVTGLGMSQEFADACVAMMAEGWAAPKIDAQGDKLKAALAKPAAVPAPMVGLVSLPKLGKWCIVEKTGVERVDQGKYEQEVREKAFSDLVGERGAYLIAQWFKLDNIEKRTGFERIRDGRAPAPREGVQEDKQHPLLNF